MENWGHLASIVPRLVDALLAQGRDDEGLRLMEFTERRVVPEDVDGQVGWRRVKAKVLARRGDLEEAERLARDATAIAGRTDYLDLRAQAVADLAEVLRLLGRRKESASALEEAIPTVRREGQRRRRGQAPRFAGRAATRSLKRPRLGRPLYDRGEPRR
jgi:ATP/maltotriose-dependent transcriptional regulator MalT